MAIVNHTNLTSDTHLMPLGSIPPNSTVWLKDIRACPDAQIRLAEMGLTYSSPIFIAINSGKGPVIVVSKNVKIIIGRGLAEKILVQFTE